jgi:hypothetical protein
MKKCPKCKINELHKEEVMNSLSRRDNKTYICSTCANIEAMEDLMSEEIRECEICGGDYIKCPCVEPEGPIVESPAGIWGFRDGVK